MKDVVALDAALLRSMPLPSPEEGSKEARGRIAIVGGSAEIPGAVMLAGVAALRAGAGKLQIATVESRAGGLGVAIPEARVLSLPQTIEGGIARGCSARLCRELARADALLIGPGMVEEEDGHGLTADLLAQIPGPPVVLDAGALPRLPEYREAITLRAGGVVVTPHAGEMANLLDIDREEVERDPLGIARSVASDFGIVVVMKGSHTFVVNPEQQAWRYDGGCVGLATSGSGDVLGGVIAGLLARGAEPSQAAIWGVYLHGEAGSSLARSIGPLGFLARELSAEVPKLMAGVGSADQP